MGERYRPAYRLVLEDGLRLARVPEPLQAFALINDQESGVAGDYLDALRNYEISALRWSRRDEALVALQS